MINSSGDYVVSFLVSRFVDLAKTGLACHQKGIAKAPSGIDGVCK